mmetsp:Transcript_30026/g.79203  ORF Transcript_30026/g.79203 Transcript_30026/m.79203 type:complete len:640 (-) Transcript_30026:272-2191(-)
MTCHYRQLCVVTLYAASYKDVLGSTLTNETVHADQIGPLHTVDIWGRVTQFAKLGPEVRLYSGQVVARNLTFGAASLNFTANLQADIGQIRVACLRAKTNEGSCSSPAFCVQVKIGGSAPVFTAPTPPMDQGLPITPAVPSAVAVCQDTDSFVRLRAVDPDVGDLVSLSAKDRDTAVDGLDFFAPPYATQRFGVYNGSSTVATMMVTYHLDVTTGMTVDNVTRLVQFRPGRTVCSQPEDSTLLQYYRFGDIPRGNYLGIVACQTYRFLGPPAFITNALRLDTPFSPILFGTRAQRARTLDGFAGVEKRFRFRAQDPNAEDIISILILEDPGVPDGAEVRPVECEATPTSACSLAHREIVWTPAVIDLGRMRAICAVARDSSTLCKPPNSADPRATSIGWYGEEHCVSIRVVGPSLRWNGTYLPSAPSTAGGAGMFPALRGYVGCSVKVRSGKGSQSIVCGWFLVCAFGDPPPNIHTATTPDPHRCGGILRRPGRRHVAPRPVPLLPGPHPPRRLHDGRLRRSRHRARAGGGRGGGVAGPPGWVESDPEPGSKEREQAGAGDGGAGRGAGDGGPHPGGVRGSGRAGDERRGGIGGGGDGGVRGDRDPAVHVLRGDRGHAGGGHEPAGGRQQLAAAVGGQR